MLLIPAFPGVTLCVRFFQVGDSEFRVVADGIEGFVTEQFLYMVKVSPGPNEFGCTAPAERVRGDVNIEPGTVRIAGQAPGYDVMFQSVAVAIMSARTLPDGIIFMLIDGEFSICFNLFDG